MGVVEKIIEALEEDVNRELGQPYLQSGNYKVYEFNEDNFKPLRDVEPRLMAFVDGGNNTILEAPTFSLQINRIYFNLFKGKERHRSSFQIPEKIEFLSYFNVWESEDGQIGKVRIFPLSEEHREYLPREKDLIVTLPGPPDFYQRSRMFSVARRFAEWSFSAHIIEELDDGDILVKDGSLQTSFEGENKYLGKVMKAAYKGGVNLAGLSKTSTLSTDTGNSLIASIKKFAEYNNYDRWCYYPIAKEMVESMERPGSIIMAVKLHELTEYIFRLDLLKGDDDEVEIVSAIGENTVDPTFPGYPYGLIDADLNARVRMDEVKIYKTRILSGLSEDILEELKSHIRAIDAHERLNMIANITRD